MYSVRKKNSSGVKVILPLLVIIIIVAAFWLIAPFIVSGKVETVPVSFYFEQNLIKPSPHTDSCRLSVMTLNMGHGRGAGLHQLMQSRNKITHNADIIAEVIKREKPDIVGLQEVDGPGFWNGGLDLIEHLAETSGFPHGIWTRNVDTPALSYGTAILSMNAYAHAESYTFRARPIVLPKGFTTGIFRLSAESNKHVCVVSVHLAPILGFMRKNQVDALIRNIEDIEYPLIIMGDFNCGWTKDSAVRYLAEKLNLKSWDPDSKELGTHSPGRRRLDWILISEDLDFIDYYVIEDRLSDHRAVKATIRCGS